MAVDCNDMTGAKERIQNKELYCAELNYGVVLDLLSEVHRSLRRMSRPYPWKKRKRVSFTGRSDPSVIYFQRILSLWTEQFRGALTLSWDAVKGRYSGRLTAFFFAVVRPVMGCRTPSPQSIKKIVGQQRRFIQWKSSQVHWVAPKPS